jgi:3-methyladenine DNA glycosylase/8-oxoguanine DNA glycosylase
MDAIWRDHRSVVLTRTDPFPVLVAAILEQKVQGLEARTAWREIVTATADPAPGEVGLRLPPDAERLAAIPSWQLTKLGVVHRRASALREVARHPKKIAALVDAPNDRARAFLAKLPGVGPWTIGEVGRLAFGDPDAVSVGDYHLPHIVSWAFAGEPRGTDERMLELLEPYRGQRGRVQVLLEASGVTAPAFGPKMERREFG